MNVELEPRHADAILAALEAALNARLDFGPGITRANVEEAGRRIEAVADLQRRGIDPEPEEGMGTKPERTM